MPDRLFTSTPTSKKTYSGIPKCGLCGLNKTCRTPKMKTYGKGRKKILTVAEAPGEKEDQIGRPLVGKTGMRYESDLDELGINLTKDCWRTNACICRPVENKTPDDEKIEACLPNLIKTIEKLEPVVIITLGAVATRAVVGWSWDNRNIKIGSISRWVGHVIPCQKPNAWIIPTYHPSYLMRMHNETLDLIFQNHLAAAIKKIGARPWPRGIPDYENEIEIFTNPAKAARVIRHRMRRAKTISFDLEGNCLKPEYANSKIVSCSICFNGGHTIAYPWFAESVDATAAILKSPCRKIAANIKFEDRWIRNKLGFNVKRWYWDTMVAAHVLDSRPEINSLKFQSFVKLGRARYDRHIEPLLKQSRGHINRIDEIDLDDLLLYNGLDSKLCYDVAMCQIKETGLRSE